MSIPAEHSRPVTGHDREYLPPTARRWPLAFYDPLSHLVGIRRVHRRLVADAALRPGHRVLDIGCGTGAVALLAKAAQPEALVVGLDPDFAALARARNKSRRKRLDVQWDVGSAAELPYPDDSVDRVFSAFMLHHLPGEQEPALAEVRRVLRADGELHLVDVGGPHGHGRREHGHPDDDQKPDHHQDPGHLHHEHVSGGTIADLLRRTGFADVTVTDRQVRFFGGVIAVRAR